MDFAHVILIVVITVLLIDRVWDRHQSMKQQDKMNKAFIARTVPEYDYSAKDEIKKVREENKLALHAEKLVESQNSLGPHYPVT